MSKKTTSKTKTTSEPRQRLDQLDPSTYIAPCLKAGRVLTPKEQQVTRLIHLGMPLAEVCMKTGVHPAHVYQLAGLDPKANLTEYNSVLRQFKTRNQI